MPLAPLAAVRQRAAREAAEPRNFRARRRALRRRGRAVRGRGLGLGGRRRERGRRRLAARARRVEALGGGAHVDLGLAVGDQRSQRVARRRQRRVQRGQQRAPHLLDPAHGVSSVEIGGGGWAQGAARPQAACARERARALTPPCPPPPTSRQRG